MTRLVWGISLLLVPLIAPLTYAQCNPYYCNGAFLVPSIPPSAVVPAPAPRYNTYGYEPREYRYEPPPPPSPGRHMLNDPGRTPPPFDPFKDAQETDEFFMMQRQTEALEDLSRNSGSWGIQAPDWPQSF